MEKKQNYSVDVEKVKYIAHLARIDLKEQELILLSSQLKKILDFIDQLKELDVEKVPPTSHVLSLKNVLREDMPQESLPLDETLKNAPQFKDNFFVVPKIIE